MSKRAEPLSDGIPNVQRLPSFLAGRWAIVLAGVVLVLAVLGAYHNSFSVPFLFDDADAITDNPTIRRLWPVWAVLSPPAGGTTVGGRPVVNFSLAVNHAFGGTAVWGYHFLNVAVHILSSLALLGIVRRTLLLKPALRERFGAVALPLAFAVALLWTLHPLQTESVTYLVQRAESLMGLFYLLTVYAFIRGTQSGAVGWYVLALGACLLGMATKEVMVSAPLMVWLYDRTFVAGTFREALRRRWRVYAGLGAGWLLLACLVARTGELGSERAGFQTVVAWWSYVLTQFWAVAHYLRLSIWPHPLVLDYGTQLITRAAQVVPAAVVVVGLCVCVIASLRRWPAIGFLGCCFFVILAPTSSVLPLVGQPVAEHRMYLPLAAVVALVVLGVYVWIGRRSLLVFLAVAVALGLLTSRRNEDYRSELAIWSDTMAKRPNNARARANLGGALFRQGRLPEAIDHFQEALQMQSENPDVHTGLGAALFQLGQIPEAIGHYERALAIKPDHAKAHSNLGMALSRSGRVAEAITHYEQALRITPECAEVHNNLGVVLLEQGKLREAANQCEQALRSKPNFAEAHYNLGTSLLRQGQVAEAIGHLEQALRLSPEDADMHWNLEVARIQLGEGLAAQGKLDEAIQQYQRAVEMNTNNVQAHESLGMALSRQGQFAAAVEHYHKALELAKDAGSAETAQRIHERLVLYQAGQPYHEGTKAPP